MLVLYLAALLPSCAAYSLSSSARGSHAATSVRSSVTMVEPFTTAAVAFAAGAVPPSFLLAQKRAELKEVQEEYNKQLEEMALVRATYMDMVNMLELKVEATDMQLVELVKSGTKQAAGLKDQMEDLKASYRDQIIQLKELAGDYSDKLELQQNTIKRKDDMVLAAEGESRALLQSIAVLESRLQAAEQALTEAQAKISIPSKAQAKTSIPSASTMNADGGNFFDNFFKLFSQK